MRDQLLARGLVFRLRLNTPQFEMVQLATSATNDGRGTVRVLHDQDRNALLMAGRCDGDPALTLAKRLHNQFRLPGVDFNPIPGRLD